MWNNLPRWRHDFVREKTTIRTFVVQISDLLNWRNQPGKLVDSF
jgi:hypothetical protein